MQGRKVDLGPDEELVLGADAQPASTVAIPTIARPLIRRLREVILKLSSKVLSRHSCRDRMGVQVTECYDAARPALYPVA
jgi:hypothetical protein